VSSEIQAITSDSNGNIWFSDPASNKIGEITPAGHLNTGPGGQIAYINENNQQISLGSFTDSNDNGPYTVDVAWGDASNSTFVVPKGMLTAPNPYPLRYSHTYRSADPNSTVEVTVTGSDYISDFQSFQLTAQPMPTITSLTSSSNPIVSGELVTLTATV